MLSQLAITATLALVAAAANCGSGPYPECVTVYKGTGCQSFNKETSYRPTCEGNCYVYPVSFLRCYPLLHSLLTLTPVRLS